MSSPLLPEVETRRPNFFIMRYGALIVYQSYETRVGFRLGPHLVVLRNYWGPTTGKHLNLIDPDKKIRVDQEKFDKLWREIAEPFLSGRNEAPNDVAKSDGPSKRSILVP
jgi:hypothetical protein